MMRGSCGENALAEPGVVGPAHRHLDLDLRMQAEEQHRRREQAGIVDAHGVHPFQRHADVAVMRCAELVVPADVVPAQLVAGDAPADVLVADLAAEHGGAAAALRRFDRLAADHRTFDVFEHVLVGFALVVMRVDVDDQEILIVALARLLGRVLEMLRGGVVLGG